MPHCGLILLRVRVNYTTSTTHRNCHQVVCPSWSRYWLIFSWPESLFLSSERVVGTLLIILLLNSWTRVMQPLWLLFCYTQPFYISEYALRQNFIDTQRPAHGAYNFFEYMLYGDALACYILIVCYLLWPYSESPCSSALSEHKLDDARLYFAFCTRLLWVLHQPITPTYHSEFSNCQLSTRFMTPAREQDQLRSKLGKAFLSCNTKHTLHNLCRPDLKALSPCSYPKHRT